MTRNTVLSEPRRGSDYLLCRDCRKCSVAFISQFDGILKRDIGWCEEICEFVDPDERLWPEDVEDCYEAQ